MDISGQCLSSDVSGQCFLQMCLDGVCLQMCPGSACLRTCPVGFISWHCLFLNVSRQCWSPVVLIWCLSPDVSGQCLSLDASMWYLSCLRMFQGGVYLQTMFVSGCVQWVFVSDVSSLVSLRTVLVSRHIRECLSPGVVYPLLVFIYMGCLSPGGVFLRLCLGGVSHQTESVSKCVQQ